MAMGIRSPELLMKNIIPVVMAGVLGIYGMIVAVILNGKIEPSFQYGDPMLEVCKEASNIRDLDTYAKTHFEERSGVDPDLNRGELSVVIPSKFITYSFLERIFLIIIIALF